MAECHRSPGVVAFRSDVVILAAAGLVMGGGRSRSGVGGSQTARWLLAAPRDGVIAAQPASLVPEGQVAGLKLLSVTTARNLSRSPCSPSAALLSTSVRTAWRRRSPLAFYAMATVVMWLSAWPGATR